MEDMCGWGMGAPILQIIRMREERILGIEARAERSWIYTDTRVQFSIPPPLGLEARSGSIEGLGFGATKGTSHGLA